MYWIDVHVTGQKLCIRSKYFRVAHTQKNGAMLAVLAEGSVIRERYKMEDRKCVLSGKSVRAVVDTCTWQRHTGFSSCI